MIAPTGYASTAVWAAFEWWSKEHLTDLPGFDTSWFWPAFRDGYSAGLAEQDV